MRKSQHISSLLSMPVPSWVIAPFARHKTLTMISAPQSSGKSALLSYIGLMASGGAAFLDFPPPAMARKVLFIGLDAPSYDYAAIARKLLAPLEPYCLADFDFWVSSEPIDILSPAFIDLISEVTEEIVTPSDEGVDIDHWLPELVIIDAFISIHSMDENSSKEMKPVMAALRALAEAGPAVVFAHHETKGGDSAGTARGSTVIPASVDMHLALRSRKFEGGLNIKGKWKKGRGSELAEDFQCTLTWDEESMRIIGDEEEIRLRAARVKEREKRILRALKALDPKTTYLWADLLKLIKISPRELKAYVERGQFTKVEGGWRHALNPRHHPSLQ